MSLPDGWTKVKLADVTTRITDGEHATPVRCDRGVPLLSARNVRDGFIDLENTDFISEETHSQLSKRLQVQEGDLLLTCSGSLGRVAIVPADAKFSLVRSVAVIKPFAGMGPFIFWALRSPQIQAQINAEKTQTAQANIFQNKIKLLEFPLPPLNEQRRIVARIEELTARSKTAKEALQAIPPLLEKFRQSVLAAAFRGDLTAEWRRQNPDAEPAESLMRRIKQERGAKAVGIARNSRRREPDCAKGLDERSELPPGWCWATLEECSGLEANSICAGPFGTIFKAHDFRPQGVPIVFLRHVLPFNYRPEHKPCFMHTGRWNEIFQPYSVFGGELLVTKLGDPPGACAEYPIGLGPAMVTPDVIKVSVHPSISPPYLLGYLNSAEARKYATEESYGATRARINLSLFREQPVPVAPLAEQLIISQLITESVQFIRKQEAALEQLRALSQALDQSILAKAFRGELVPQDPNDEPASALLDRLSTQTAPTRTRKTR